MVDISRFTAPKSDQLNADDLIAGPRTVRIREVREMGGADQPIAIFYEGDNGKPYKPCKSMMRALMFVWGPNGADYVGRAMTLFRDPSVTWGGEAIGGIRISHMSDMEGGRAMEFPLTATRGKRQLYRVEPLAAAAPRKTAGEHVAEYVESVARAADLSELMELAGKAEPLREALRKAGDRGAPLLESMGEAERKRNAELSASSADDEPGEEQELSDIDPDDLDDAFADDGDPFANEESLS